METISLPPLVKTEKVGKNVISQVLLKDIIIKPTTNTGRGNRLFLHEDSLTYCVIKKGSKIPEGYDYVLISEDKPVLEELKGNGKKLKWKLHPKLNDQFDVERCSESWDSAFNFKTEEPEKNRKGLRVPQIGALHATLSH